MQQMYPAEPQQQISPGRMEALAAAVRELDAQLELDADDEVAPEMTAEEVAASSVAHGEPELLPVPASVFDDAFFRAQPEHLTSAVREPEMSIATDTRIYAGTVGTVTAAHTEVADSDELDIPAFLRRGH